jgi:hypothetical protein
MYMYTCTCTRACICGGAWHLAGSFDDDIISATHTQRHHRDAGLNGEYETTLFERLQIAVHSSCALGENQHRSVAGLDVRVYELGFRF